MNPRTATITALIIDSLNRCGLDYTPSPAIDNALADLMNRKPKNTPRTNSNIAGEIASLIITDKLS